MRGDGSVYRHGSVFYCKFYVDGETVRENTKATDEEGARKYLRTRIKQKHAHDINATTFITVQDAKLTIGEILGWVKSDFELRGKASAQNLSHIKRAVRDFGDVRAIQLTSEQIDEYQKQRLADGDKPATINRALQVLRQAFTLAARRGRLARVPYIRMLSEKGNERKGFFTEAEFRRLLSHLPSDGLADFAEFSFATGMRKAEAAGLSWAMVKGDELQIPGDICKNRMGRTLPISGEIAEIIERRKTARRIEENGTVRMAEFIFHRGDGEAIREFRKSWARAAVAAHFGVMVCPNCKAEGDALTCATCEVATIYRGRVWHDFRRSAIRNMRKAGISTQDAKAWSGHKSDSVFQRYSIITTDDMRETMRRTEKYRRASLAQSKVVGLK